MTHISTLDEILSKVEEMIKEGLNIRAVTLRERGRYHVNIMARYQEGGGIGCLGSVCLLEIKYKSKHTADKTTDAINAMAANP